VTSFGGGTCFGFAVEPVMPFTFVRGGWGEPLDVQVASSADPAPSGTLVREWRVEGPEPFFAGLYTASDGYRLWAAESGWFEIGTNPARISVPSEGNEIKREERLWSIPVLLCFQARGDVPLHAAAIDVGGGAILIAAPGRFGKTTMAAGFVRAGYRLLSEDLCCIQVTDGCSTVPGPAMLRIRPDVAEELEIPNAAVVDAGDARLHLALDPAQRGDCSPVPIHAAVFLQGGVDEISLQRVEASEALRNLFALIFRLPGAAETERAFTAAATISAQVPSWSLSYPYGLDVLEHVVDTLVTRLAG
jgi:hypothetical protein